MAENVVEKEPRALLVGAQAGAATAGTTMEGPQKVTGGASNPTVGNLPKENENTNRKGHLHSYVYRSVIYHSQDRKARRCRGREQMKQVREN